MIVTLEHQYSISFPASLVHSLKLRKGDKLECLPGKRELRLVPLPQSVTDSVEDANASQCVRQIPLFPGPYRNPSSRYVVSGNSVYA